VIATRQDPYASCDGEPAGLASDIVTARALWWVPVLLSVSAFMYPLQFVFIEGAQFREPLVQACHEQAPQGWHEATHAEWSWTGTPPRLECRMLNRVTGETTYWESARSTAVVPWAIMILALLAAALLPVAVALQVGHDRKSRRASRTG
jgi:hypothetical protein